MSDITQKIRVLAEEGFDETWDECPKIDYSKDFANNTGYLDYAAFFGSTMEAPVAFIDEYQRKAIIMPLGLKSAIVVFERYRNSRPGERVFTSNRHYGEDVPKKMKNAIEFTYLSSLDSDTLNHFIREVRSSLITAAA